MAISRQAWESRKRHIAVAFIAVAMSVLAAPSAASARPLPGDNPYPACKVDVRGSKLVQGVAYHLFVVYHCKGAYKYYRGGPGSGGGSSSRASSSSSGSSGSRRLIVTEYGDYKPGTIDYNAEAPSVTVLLGRNAEGKNRCFKAQADRIEKRHLVYNSFGPNSNSVAYTLLARCHVPTDKPRVNTPGWGQLL